jgi:tetratricopeptide (TPR) repeat protein
MTRQELADAINDHVFRATNNRGAVDERHIGKWERGETTWPRKHYRAALRAVLNVATDAELGLARRRQSTDDEDVNRKQFLKTTLAVSAAMLTNAAPSEAELLDTMSGPTTNYRRMESSVPSDRLWPAVEAHLDLVSGVVHDRVRTASGYRTLSEVAGLAAWLAADRGDDAAARQRYRAAITYAERTHHPLLVSYMTASLGHYAVETGDGGAGLALLHTASAQMGQNAPDSAGAWLSSLLAVAYAATGDRKAALAALDHAERLADRQRGEPQWPWVFAFDGAKAARYQASALGRLGDHRAARRAFAAAAPALGADKPRALAQVEHAHVLAQSGNVEQGCALAADALRIGLALRSERITRVARTFRATLPTRTTAARPLDDALATLYKRDGR